MLERRWDLAVVTGYAVLAACVVWAIHPGSLGGLFLVPLLMVCPGYALIQAIEGVRPPGPLEFAVTTVALSFATAALGGLAINAFGLGLTPHTWSALFVIVTLGAAAVATRRRRGELAPRLSVRVGGTTLLAIVAMFALVVSAAVIAVRSQRSQDRQTSTPALDVAASHGGSMLRIAVVNSDLGARRYRVRVYAGHRIVDNFSLALASDEQWFGTWHVARSFTGPLRVELFAGSKANMPLRTVNLSGRTGPSSHQ